MCEWGKSIKDDNLVWAKMAGRIVVLLMEIEGSGKGTDLEEGMFWIQLWTCWSVGRRASTGKCGREACGKAGNRDLRDHW